jgi:hypothetical protein
MPFFRRSQVWVVEFTHDGRRRRWFKALPQGADAASEMRSLLQELYGAHARLVEVHPATAQEELDFSRGNLPKNVLCPTGRTPRSSPQEPD